MQRRRKNLFQHVSIHTTKYRGKKTCLKTWFQKMGNVCLFNDLKRRLKHDIFSSFSSHSRGCQKFLEKKVIQTAFVIFKREKFRLVSWEFSGADDRLYSARKQKQMSRVTRARVFWGLVCIHSCDKDPSSSFFHQHCTRNRHTGKFRSVSFVSFSGVSFI